MARDFPNDKYAEIEQRFRKYSNTAASTPSPLDQEFTLAWLAFQYRYRATDEHSLDFHRLWLDYGRAPDEPYIYQQERAFQGFHFNALSSIETGCYALYMLASRFNPGLNLIGSKPTKALRDVSIKNCAERLNKTQQPAHLQSFFSNLTGDKDYQELTEIRNISSHRAVILRHVTVGAQNPTQTEIELSSKRISMDENFTEVRRNWLAGKLDEVTKEALQLLADGKVP